MEFRARANALASPSFARRHDAHLPVCLVQVLHAEYVDNFVALGASEDAAAAAAETLDRSLRGAGFRAHGQQS
eukprot:2096543-Pyramimonas_sp.AAC.1